MFRYKRPRHSSYITHQWSYCTRHATVHTAERHNKIWHQNLTQVFSKLYTFPNSSLSFTLDKIYNLSNIHPWQNIYSSGTERIFLHGRTYISQQQNEYPRTPKRHFTVKEKKKTSERFSKPVQTKQTKKKRSHGNMNMEQIEIQELA